VKQTVLVTGARGFVGQNLMARLSERAGVRVRAFSRRNTQVELATWAAEADVVVHLAGANRPVDPEGLQTDNVGFTKRLVELLRAGSNAPHLIFASSIQAALDNPYGRSKRQAEDVIMRWSAQTGARATVLRLKNVFGKWSRPNYNSVVATFCHNVAHGLPISVRDPDHEVELVHVDDVVDTLLQAIESARPIGSPGSIVDKTPFQRISVGELAERISSFREGRDTLMVTDLSSRFNRQLYGTYVSYLEPSTFAFQLDRKSDHRGDLAEFIKSPWFGQIFVSRTKPGITRGNHYHHTKVEKFLVVAGSALIRFRHIHNLDVLEFPVLGEEYRVVEIPPGYTHSITNTGESEMITLFWASEVFDSGRPDTFHCPVIASAESEPQ
jgi:UDP-2-acetamido-2,6-beta-L-arabino-hexul-4-ose reductase